MKNIMITGGLGFLGSHLAKRLLERGENVIIVDNLVTGQDRFISQFKKYKNCTIHTIGIETKAFETKFINNKKIKIDMIYDMACPTGVPNIQKLGIEMVEACSTGTKNVMELAKAQKATVVYNSSSEIYGDPLVYPQSETYTGNVDPLGWRAFYEEGKRFSETLCKLYAEKFGVQVKIVRLFNVYGEHMEPTEQRVLPRFISNALKNKPIPVHDDGKQGRTMCYVEDTLDGIELVMKKGKKGEAYNLGSDESISMKDLAEMVIKNTNTKSKISFTKGMPSDHKGRMPDLTKIHKLGWKQKTSFQEGLEKMINFYKENHFKK